MSEVVRDRKNSDQNQVGQGTGRIPSPESSRSQQHQHRDTRAKENICNLQRFFVEIRRAEAPEARPITKSTPQREAGNELRILFNELQRHRLLLSYIRYLPQGFIPLHLVGIACRMRPHRIRLERIAIISRPALQPEVIPYRPRKVHRTIVANRPWRQYRNQPYRGNRTSQQPPRIATPYLH